MCENINEQQTTETNEEKAEKKKVSKSKAAEIEGLKAALNEKEQEIEKQKDMLLRVSAEYDNYRRRTSEEMMKKRGDAVADTAEKFLAVLDNIERALAAQHSDEDVVYQGLCMIAKQFNETLSLLGVEEIDTSIPFDPKLHNAVMHCEDEEKGEGEIIEVFGKGYKIGERILRYSIVKVAN